MRKILFLAIMVFTTFAFQTLAQNKTEATGQTLVETPRYEINCMNIPVLSKSEVKVFEAEDLKHTVGYSVQGGWAVKNRFGWDNLQRGDGGYLVKGGYISKPGSGGLRVVFRLKTDVNNIGVWDKLMRLEIFDSTSGNVITQHIVERNYFRASDQFQNFVLHADLKGREDHTIEARIWYLGNAYVEIDKLMFIKDRYEAGTPAIINQSSSSDDHVKKLLNEAVTGLGFSNTTYEGPNANDLIYVNNYYMAWVDQTGYYGKMNGLWILNNKSGNSLNFPQNTRFNGRVVNFLAVAEDGDGKWLGSYMGTEHFEVPSYVKEDDDDETPVEKGISNWFSANEANPIYGTGGLGPIPWWVCCSGDMNNKQSFGQINPPDQYALQNTQLTIKYLAPLTKSSDADGAYDGDRCHANILFYNNIRYPLYLKVGYIFYKDKPYLDRSYQILNPAGNATLPANTYMSLIHGILLTKTSSTIPWKGDMFSFVMPNGKNMRINRTSNPAGAWVPLNDPASTRDLISGMSAPNSAFTISNNKSFEVGNSFYHSLYFDTLSVQQITGDVVVCQCVVHGSWEMGSGLFPNNTPIQAGRATGEAFRRFGFPQGEAINDDKLLNQKK